MNAVITMIGGEQLSVSGDSVRWLYANVMNTGTATPIHWISSNSLAINLQNALKIEFKEESL